MSDAFVAFVRHEDKVLLMQRADGVADFPGEHGTVCMELVTPPILMQSPLVSKKPLEFRRPT